MLPVLLLTYRRPWFASVLRAGQGERLSNSPGGTYGCFSSEKGSIGSLTMSSSANL